MRPDAENAEVWLARSADRGDVSSMTLLGSAHLDKIVPDSDPQQGIDYLQRAAAQGDDTARARLGTAYLFGADGVPAQPQQGVELLQAAADNGHAGAMRSEERTSELQSLMRHSYAVFCLKK